MASPKWLPRFTALVQEIEGHPQLEITAREIGAPATSEALSDAEDFMGQPLAPALKQLYAELDGFHLAWHHRDPAWRDAGVGGSIRIFPLRTVFRPDWGQPDYGSKAHLPFDWPQDDHFAGFGVDDGQVYWVCDSEGAAEPFGASFEAYLEAMLEARGFGSWQEMFLYSDARMQRLGLGRTVEQSHNLLYPAARFLFGDVNGEKLGGCLECPSGPRWAELKQMIAAAAALSADPSGAPGDAVLLYGEMLYRDQPAALVRQSESFIAQLAQRESSPVALVTTGPTDGADDGIIGAAIAGVVVARAPVGGQADIASACFHPASLPEAPPEIVEELDPAGNVDDHIGYWLVSPERPAALTLDGSPVVSVDAGQAVSVESDEAHRLLSSGATLQLRCGEQTQSQPAAAPETPDLEAGRVVLFRLADAPSWVSADVGEDDPTRRCLFWLASADADLGEIFEAVPEPELEDTGPGERALERAYQVAVRSGRFASLFGESCQQGFHAGDPDDVEAFIRAKGCAVSAPAALFGELSYLVVGDDERSLPVMQRWTGVARVFFEAIEDHENDGPAVFVLDRRELDGAELRLFSSPNMDGEGPEPGPGERFVALSVDDLPEGELTTVAPRRG